MLKYRVDEIPEGGVEIAEDRGAEWFAPLLIPQFLPADAPLRIAYRLSRAGNAVVASGRITGRLAFVCSRCAEETPFVVAHAFSHVYIEGKETSGVPEDVADPAEPDFSFIENGEVDLEALAGEELVLLLPQVPLCAESCKGICQRCGSNLNEGPCGCKAEETDPRWAKLHELKL